MGRRFLVWGSVSWPAWAGTAAAAGRQPVVARGRGIGLDVAWRASSSPTTGSMAESTGQPRTAREVPPFGGLPPAILNPGPSERQSRLDHSSHPGCDRRARWITEPVATTCRTEDDVAHHADSQTAP